MSLPQLYIKPESGSMPCEHKRTVISTTGGYHFNAEVWDDLEDSIVCLDCGKELYPGVQPDLTPAELADLLSNLEESC